MSILTVALPAQAIIASTSIGSAVAASARPLLGLGALLVFFMMFKPLLLGLARAAVLVVKPRLSLAERHARRRIRGAVKLYRMADSFDASQPNLAAELRALASRS